MPSEVEGIEAILNEKLRLVVGNRNGVDYAAGIDGIPEAAAAIAALRSKDREREDGAREMRERAKTACLDYGEACLDRGIGLLHERDLPRTGDAIGWADAATGCARLVAALPLQPTPKGDGTDA